MSHLSSLLIQGSDLDLAQIKPCIFDAMYSGCLWPLSELLSFSAGGSKVPFIVLFISWSGLVRKDYFLVKVGGSPFRTKTDNWLFLYKVLLIVCTHLIIRVLPIISVVQLMQSKLQVQYIFFLKLGVVWNDSHRVQDLGVKRLLWVVKGGSHRDSKNTVFPTRPPQAHSLCHPFVLKSPERYRRSLS